MSVEAGFWTHLEQLVASCRVVVDRPRGSRHPRYPEFIYPADYGYLEGTRSMDGAGIDVWLGSDSARQLDALIVTVDLLKRDAEIKLLLGCSEEEKAAILRCHNSDGMRGLLMRRE